MNEVKESRQLHSAPVCVCACVRETWKDDTIRYLDTIETQTQTSQVEWLIRKILCSKWNRTCVQCSRSESNVIALIFRIKWKCNSFAWVSRLISKQFTCVYWKGYSVQVCTQHQRCRRRRRRPPCSMTAKKTSKEILLVHTRGLSRRWKSCAKKYFAHYSSTV